MKKKENLLRRMLKEILVSGDPLTFCSIAWKEICTLQKIINPDPMYMFSCEVHGKGNPSISILVICIRLRQNI